MMADSSTFDVNDAVHVERGVSQQPLEGVVAYVGKVQFADGDDWIGVRLTGISVGLGKNDGNVNGVSYFSCGPQGGVFVRKSHVSKRELSKLEALRLKRELAKQSAGITSPKPSATTTTCIRTMPLSSPTAPTPTSTRAPSAKTTQSQTQSTTPRTSATTTAAAATSGMTGGSTLSPSKQARLDEIRERRAALSRKYVVTTSSSSTPPTNTTSSPEKASIEMEQLQKQLEEMEKEVNALKEQMDSTEQENAFLRESLAKAENTLEDQKKAKAPPPQPVVVLATESSSNNEHELEMKLQTSEQNCRDLQEQLETVVTDMKRLQKELAREQQDRVFDGNELTHVRAELSALQNEFSAMTSQQTNRSASDASHYKERAKLQVELGAAHRKVEELEKEKQELENVLEDLTLDKEQLQEEKEALGDRVEELKIDSETAQMEVEELRMELEIAKEAAERVGGSTAVGADGGADTDEAVQALSIQNARLREALIRLREQASTEKMDVSRELRSVEKAATAAAAMTEELERLREDKQKLDNEVGDLKEMVDQGSAFESMVESLSDRVMVLEDDNLALQATIREMEEAADITAEMEEVQAEENKALLRDLEGRDSIVRNLEEAIKMQRRREEDFQRTVRNYRKTVETLKEEKKALMAFHEGGEDEKGDLIATSQKALARAAQLVADATISRKREAEAVFDRIEADVQRHLSERMESLLPENVVSSEVASVKGEMLLSQVAGKASRSLEGMSTVFARLIRSGINKISAEADEELPVQEGGSFVVTDEASETIMNMLHQSEIAILTINVASDLIKLLLMGQWPDLLSPDASTELGAVAGNSIADLDVAIGDQLRILKEEGVLSPHTSDIDAFQQTVQGTMQSLTTTLEADGNVCFPKGWAPPGWQILKDVSISKFSCMGAAAVVAATVSPGDGTHAATSPVSVQVIVSTKALMTRLDQVCTEATRSCHRLVQLDLRRESALVELGGLGAEWKESSLALMKVVKETFSDKSECSQEQIADCESIAEITMKLVAQFSSALRSANLNSETDGLFHPLSPESKDAWEGVSSLARAMRSVDGDADDVNFLVRARALENQLSEAIENGPKLSQAISKVSSLEKSLASRSKEVAMQNARLSELEKVLAKASTLPSASFISSPEKSSPEELSTLKEENRVLTEAMDVLHRQVDEYENEIRALKDFKSPNSTQRSSRASRASPFLSPGMSTSKGKPGDDVLLQDASPAAVGAMEAALLRPALQAARREASVWKAQSITTMISSLPPLHHSCSLALRHRSNQNEESKQSESTRDLEILAAMLSQARSASRLEKASISIVDLSKPGKSSRLELAECTVKSAEADIKVAHAAMAVAQGLSGNENDSPTCLVFRSESNEGGKLIGRVKIGANTASVVPLAVNSSALERLYNSFNHY